MPKGAGGLRRGGTLGPKGKAAVAARPQGKSTQVRELQRLVITGGSARGRRIVTPDVYMRPMMSRVRELTRMSFPCCITTLAPPLSRCTSLMCLPSLPISPDAK